jgi:hypothetical protein
MKNIAALSALLLLMACNPKIGEGLRKNDLKKDVELTTTKGVIVLRLSDSTSLHRNNFIKLVKQHFYDSIQFHRVIKSFMIQAGILKQRAQAVSWRKKIR